MSGKLRILFLCTGNSCRSQMAEGFTRAIWGDRFDAYSAGVDPHGMNQRSIRTMAEAGVDISGGRAKHVDELAHITFDYVITVCDHAHETCPLFPYPAKILHFGFEDPPVLAKEAKTDEEAMVHYRRIRDEILEFVRILPEVLGNLEA